MISVVGLLEKARSFNHLGRPEKVDALLEIAIETLESSPAPKAPKPKLLVQTDLLEKAKDINEWDQIIRKWISKFSIGDTFTHHQLCKWITEESGVVLNDADSQTHPNDKTPTWRRRVSRALRGLKAKKILSSDYSASQGLRSFSYVVARRP